MQTPLKIERMKRKMSGEALARQVGITQSYIARLENGKSHPSLEVANRIAKYLGNAVTRDQILFPEDYIQPEQPPKKPIPQRLRKAS
jgi:transcriptional regulator with XRE-family HTH domain